MSVGSLGSWAGTAQLSWGRAILRLDGTGWLPGAGCASLMSPLQEATTIVLLDFHGFRTDPQPPFKCISDPHQLAEGGGWPQMAPSLHSVTSLVCLLSAQAAPCPSRLAG